MRNKILIALFLGGVMLAVVQAQQPGRGFGQFMTGPQGLLNAKAVQEDLKLTEDQVTQVTKWEKDFREKASEIRKEKGVETGKGGGFTKGGPTPEQQEKMAAANAEISKVAYKELGDILKKEQVERLKQIDRQNMGINAFTDTEVVSALNLTDSQKTSIKGLSGDFAKDRREIMAEVGGGKGGGGKNFDVEKFQEAQKKVSKVQKEYLGKAVDLLTDDQKKTWKTLIGESFDLTKLTPTFRKKD